MRPTDRRGFLRTLAGAAARGAALSAVAPAIQRALAIPARRRTRTLQDVEHVVIFMQENRSFDHYFGTLRGVRGFGDRFPIPVADAPGLSHRNVWLQPSEAGAAITPFRLDTGEQFGLMRVEGTPHSFPDAQRAWAEGRMNAWPLAKRDHSLGYYAEHDLPFQFALAEAFTICDAYHCSFHGGTNPNRLFLWTGTNDGLAVGGGPAISNEYDNLDYDPSGGYRWGTYCERLERAGVRWQIYQNMADNFTDNPIAGFRSFRAAFAGSPGSLAALKTRGLSTRDLDLLKADVLEDALPQVSFIVATAEGSEHPGPSSPAQGAAYTERVLDALTANPEVWSKTVLLLMFDENDGFFDHVPPPAPPSRLEGEPARYAGDSTVQTTGEYHEHLNDGETGEFLHRPYGLGPRVPLYVISPWSTGGWVDSEVFDHTSVIRFLEKRFGVLEPNISPWRRAVVGDLTSAFDFTDPDHRTFVADLPATSEVAQRARSLPARTTPSAPQAVELPSQAAGVRRSRALPYELYVHGRVHHAQSQVELTFSNAGKGAAVFHVYDRLHLDRVPRRYTVEPWHRLDGTWDVADDRGAYDLWVLGPNGFHRHFSGNLTLYPYASFGAPEVQARYDSARGGLVLKLRNASPRAHVFALRANAYYSDEVERIAVGSNRELERRYTLRTSLFWYDFTVTVEELSGYSRRFAGRVETGFDGFSDPAMGGVALTHRE